MHLYFLRHGIASSDAHLHDTERPLTDAGIHQARLVGSFLRRANISIDTILSSPLLRAQQTASLVQSQIGAPVAVTSEFLVNGTDQRQLLKDLAGRTGSSILLVGHMPHLSETISLLIAERSTIDIEMKPCSIALVDIPAPLRVGTGTLQWLIPVAALAQRETT
jgi:phosphohistidine phosphatase